MALFSSNKSNDGLSQQDLQELFQRLEHLERKCRRMDKRLVELEEKCSSLCGTIPSPSVTQQPSANTDSLGEHVNSVDGIGSLSEEAPVVITMPVDVPLTAASSLSPSSLSTPVRTLYLPAPTQDGLFLQTSEHEQIGKSIYQLTTSDGQNGTFLLLDTPDAIATAMISVSTFIKPVCKVNGPTAQYPRHIITEEEGTVSREGAGWRVTRKAVVRFE
ncbi:MAG: hypothetical protein IJV36_02135 [Prevotella sp.]|nr:hypothetical protein [Prevotella sp.]